MTAERWLAGDSSGLAAVLLCLGGRVSAKLLLVGMGHEQSFDLAQEILGAERLDQ
jgi:hypothetical protein